MSNDQRKFTEADVEASKALHASLMSGQLNENDVYELVKAGKVSPGLEFLINDYIDLGRLKAREFMDQYKKGLVGLKENA
tara:strand:- start:68 stop:307 length:240 start_codon:yes stop_codon:yes gene_type:complete